MDNTNCFNFNSVCLVNIENYPDRPQGCAFSRNNCYNWLEFLCSRNQKNKKLDYEKYKKFLQRPSSVTGQNLFDHIVDIINRIIDERPRNVTDYFEQYSRSVREIKLDRLDFKEPQFYEIAVSVINFIHSFLASYDIVSSYEEGPEFLESEMTIYQSSDSIHRAQIEWSLLNYTDENIFQIQHSFSYCGLGFDIDEVALLALSVQKLQLKFYVENARFWGRIFGLNGSYYVVEAVLTKSEIENRLKSMKSRLYNDMKAFIHSKEFPEESIIDEDLVPGSSWKDYPEEDLKKMDYPTAPIPELHFEKFFEAPEEPIGTGLNSRTYFVTTSLSHEWEELPNVHPKHIKASKIIKKYFTGNLNKSLEPSFPGSERHYLRAIIARISAGTFIAPKNYYRRMTRKERKLLEAACEIEEEEMESDEEDEELTNDDLITRNKDYKPLSLDELTLLKNWVHFRPNILNQGRIIHVNEELVIRDLEKKVLLSMKRANMLAEELGEILFEEECQEEGEEEEEEEEILPTETGPPLFSSCDKDINDRGIPSWSFRYSSVYNKLDQMLIARSNLWPGYYSIVFEDFCENIYMGWGVKYVPRCISLPNLPVIQDFDYEDSAREATDPTVEMEERWRAYYLKKSLQISDHEEMSVDFDCDDYADEDENPIN